MSDFINWLQDKGIIDAINALTTVVLAVFAAVQLYHIQSERKERLRTAYAASWIEFWRLWTISENWRQTDLIQSAERQLFVPDQIRPVDWGSVLAIVGQLGQLPARFMGSAYAMAGTAADSGALLQQMADRLKRKIAEAANDAERTEIRDKFLPLLQEREVKTKESARQAADTFEDGLKAAPKWLQKQRVDLEGLVSPMAVRLGEEIAKRNPTSAPLGRAGRWIGKLLGRGAGWLNP